MPPALFGKLALVTGKRDIFLIILHSRIDPWSIAGAGSGIGKATARIFAREGAKVIAADRNVESAQDTIKEIGSEGHMFLDLNVSCSKSVNQALTAAIEHFKRPPTVIVNSAGITRDGFLLKMAEEDFDSVINVNLKVTRLHHPARKLFKWSIAWRKKKSGSMRERRKPTKTGSIMREENTDMITTTNFGWSSEQRNTQIYLQYHLLLRFRCKIYFSLVHRALSW